MKDNESYKYGEIRQMFKRIDNQRRSMEPRVGIFLWLFLLSFFFGVIGIFTYWYFIIIAIPLAIIFMIAVVYYGEKDYLNPLENRCIRLGIIEEYRNNALGQIGQTQALKEFMLDANEDFKWNRTVERGRTVISPHYIFCAASLEMPVIIPRTMIKSIEINNQSTMSIVLNNETTVTANIGDHIGLEPLMPIEEFEKAIHKFMGENLLTS